MLGTALQVTSSLPEDPVCDHIGSSFPMEMSTENRDFLRRTIEENEKETRKQAIAIPTVFLYTECSVRFSILFTVPGLHSERGILVCIVNFNGS